MSSQPRFSYALPVLTILVAFALPGCDEFIPGGESYQREFAVADCTMVATGRNQYLILEPGYQIILEGPDATLQITVLDETKIVDGIVTRVVEEREWEDGELVEVSRNYFAMCEQTKDVFYFGEDVDDYADGRVVAHDGAWLAGVDGNKPGLIMPGAPQVGMKYYQEIAPGVAMDRAEIVGIDETCETSAGKFVKCMKIKESTSVDLWSSLMFWQAEYKMHAPGIGLVQDEDLELTKFGTVSNGQ